MECLKIALSSMDLKERERARKKLTKLQYYDASHFFKLIPKERRENIKNILFSVVNEIKKRHRPEYHKNYLKSLKVYDELLCRADHKSDEIDLYFFIAKNENENKRDTDYHFLLKILQEHIAESELACHWAGACSDIAGMNSLEYVFANAEKGTQA